MHQDISIDVMVLWKREHMDCIYQCWHYSDNELLEKNWLSHRVEVDFYHLNMGKKCPISCVCILTAAATAADNCMNNERRLWNSNLLCVCVCAWPQVQWRVWTPIWSTAMWSMTLRAARRWRSPTLRRRPASGVDVLSITVGSSWAWGELPSPSQSEQSGENNHVPTG